MASGALFVVVAAATVLSPGPGVVMTLSNALRGGLRGAIGGILGIACGASLVAALSATSVGVLLANSAAAFTVLKWLGAAYLIYLGLRLWRAPAARFARLAAAQSNVPAQDSGGAQFRRRFIEGASLQFANPKVIVFFVSVFPQFIDAARPYAAQFAAQVAIYGALVVVIHCLYALGAGRLRRWLAGERGGRIVGRGAGATFMLFGAALAASKR